MPTEQTQRKNAVIHKTYRDVSAEERQAVEGSATAWADVLQNGAKTSSKTKQKLKPADKSHQLNPPSEIAKVNINSYGNKPVQQKEEKPAEHDTSKSVVTEEDNISNGKEAMQRVIENHEDVGNAMYRDDVGFIDFVWGNAGRGKKFKGGYGIAHIIAKRNADFENGRSTVDGETTVKKLVDVIAKGKDITMQNTSNNDTTSARMKIHYDGYTAVLSMSDKNKNTWLLTGWEDEKTAQKKEVPVNANGEGNGSTAATPDMPMRTRHAEETDTSSTSTVPQSQQNAKGNIRSVIIVGEKYYIEDTPSVPRSNSDKKKLNRTNSQQYGNEVEVRTDDGKKIKAHYALIPADKLIASNKADDTLSKNEASPQELQPRDRQRTAMRLQVDSMANSLRPEDLADSRNPNQGAPIVRGDMTVLNGNGRTLAIQRAYQNGKAEEYTQYLMDNAEKLGLDKRQVAAMVKDKQPILVRVVDNLSKKDVASITSSTTGGQRMGATEQAKADAKKIKPDTLRKYSEDNKSNNFLGDVLNDIVPADERNAYMTKDGKINKYGLARAERALFSLAYGDESLMEDFGENLTEEARNMTNALRNNAAAIAKLQQRIEEGRAYDIGLQKNLVEAVKAIKSAVEQNKPAQSIWEEQSMFEEAAYSPETIEIAKVLHDLRRSGRKLTAFIGKLADLNKEHGNPKDEDLFAGEELAEPSLMNDIPIANEYAEELTRAKYSRDAENQLDNQGEKADNEDEAIYNSQVDKKVFEKYLSGDERKSIKNNIQKQISENIKDFNALSNPAKIDKAYSSLPLARKTRMEYNTKYVQNNEEIKNYYAVLHEYIKRYFFNDGRIQKVIATQVHDDAKQVGMASSSRQTFPKFTGKGRDVQEANSRAFATPRLGEYKGIKEQFDKLIDKHSKEKQSRDVSAFSFGENPLSEQALKAKAEFETPLDKLEKVSREKLHKTEQRIQDFGKRIGVPVHFVRHPDKGYRGVCIHNGGIYINLNSNVPARSIFMHEFTHWLKASGKDNNTIYTALASMIETKQGTFNEKRMNDYRKRLYYTHYTTTTKTIKIYNSPAYTGKTRGGMKWICKTWDHPRLRGKDIYLIPASFRIPGSPPLTRERRYSPLSKRTIQGITPAYAGKTSY